ncbi:MAG: Holliday junction branch migration protein RuvA [Clostridiaceae bacterium]
MYEYIKGIYKGIKKDYIVIENNNIGYKIFSCGSTMSNLPKIDDEITLLLKHIVREDFEGLYGFLTEEELDMFNYLININGVGTKAALSILSIGKVNNIKYAILNDDEKFLSKAPGIGKKIAQRIILELKDKLFKENKNEITNFEMSFGEDRELQNNLIEAKEALISLGYSEKESDSVLAKINKEDSLENIIKNSLKQLMN